MNGWGKHGGRREQEADPEVIGGMRDELLMLMMTQAV